MVLNIDRIRKEKGVTLVDMADAIDIKSITLRRKLNGENDFGMKEARKLHQSFFPEFDFQFLFSEEEGSDELSS